MESRIRAGFIVFVVSLLFAAAAHAAPPQSSCVQSSTSVWAGRSFTTQTTEFTATYDATPTQANMSGVIGFSLNAATSYSSLAANIRFSSTGMIDARNGAAYSANLAVSYSAGWSYHFRFVIKPATKQYDVYVTRPGQSEVALATNYAFRLEQSTTSSLNNWDMNAGTGAMTVCNMAIVANAGPPVITTQPAGQAVVAGQTASFSVTATGSAPLSYQWRENGSTISGATLASYTTPVTTTADNGAQYSVAVSNSAGSVTSNAATLTVTASALCPCTIWPSTALPAVVDPGPDNPVELGVTFRADSNGYVTGIRFYKSTGNTGTHVGHLWSGTGTLLATATFSGESASGWQQVNFSSPVAIVANTKYVASYHTNVGHYSINEYYFATSGVDRAPLHAMPNGNGVANGPYAYGGASAFPTSTYRSTNYWVDVVFNTSVNAVPAPPAITTQPAGQTVVAGQSATFSVAAAGTAPLSYQWRKNGANISGATASLYTTPATTTADNGAQFTAVVSNSSGSVPSSNATLTVNAATRLMSANPNSLSFGNIAVGGSKILTSTLTNSGNSSVTVSGVSIAGAGFNVNGVSTGQVLLPGQTASLNVTFAPAVTGSVTGSATVASNASNSPTTVSVAGTGVQLLSHSATLSWTASTSSVVGYNVYSGTVSGGPYAKITTSPVAGVTYADTGVQSGKTYYYVVTAVNTSTVESVYSNQAAAIIP